jgi:hypothetical protein
MTLCRDIRTIKSYDISRTDGSFVPSILQSFARSSVISNCSATVPKWKTRRTFISPCLQNISSKSRTGTLCRRRVLGFESVFAVSPCGRIGSKYDCRCVQAARNPCRIEPLVLEMQPHKLVSCDCIKSYHRQKFAVITMWSRTCGKEVQLLIRIQISHHER